MRPKHTFSLLALLVIIFALILAACSASPRPGRRAVPVVILEHSHFVRLTQHPFPLKDISAPIVGELLSSTNGTWTNSPTSFTYVWLRCSSTGTGCTSITGATATTYTVVSADVGHEIASQVTAINASGSASQQSNLSGVVASGAGAVTGASLAICTSTCTEAAVPSTSSSTVYCGAATSGCGNVVSSLMVSPGGGAAAENRQYAVYIPTNLKHDGTSNGQPAAVFDVMRQGCNNWKTEFADSQMGPVANSGRFIFILLQGCAPGQQNPRHPETDYPQGSSPNPSDNPFIKAAVADATTRFNLDTRRLYLVGGSSSANMARDAICSTSTTPHNSTLFRGIATMGGGAQTSLNGTKGWCPSGDKTTFWLEISGKNAGNNDPYTTINVPSHTVLGFDATRQWWSGRNTGGGAFAGGYLTNCSDAVHTTSGTGVASDVYAYTCAAGNSASPFFEGIAVTNGGHMWCYLDAVNGNNAAAPDPGDANCITGSHPNSTNNTGGFSTANTMWNFFAGTTTTS